MANKPPLAVFLVLYGLLQSQHAIGQTLEKLTSPIQSIDQTSADAGWLQLFDGKTFFGWKPTTDANWKIVDNTIVVSQGKPGLLRTTTQFDDYQLCLEFRCDASTNSGVFLRTPPQPRNPGNDCYEFNIAPESNPFPTGSLVARKKSNSTFENDGNAWRKLHIVVDQNKISATIDGESSVQFTDDSFLGRGFIGLQFNQGKIEFRNIFLRPLNTQALLDQELSQWKTDQKLESDFQVDAENTLRVTGGRGQLESKSTFADFVFSMQCRTNAVGLNSGIFFRCIPGELMNGYESQIQNEFIAGDRSAPKDCGTGGIFRRVNARRVVANDEEWFTKTIIATGPHISVWVNGIQVTDWSDTRKPNENPRRGRRITAGSFAIQGHDPTTNIDFKNIQAKELTVRWAKDR